MGPNLKLKTIFFSGGAGGGGLAGRGAGVSDFFYHEPKFKIKNKKGGGGVDGWTDEQARTNLPLQLLRSWGHDNALMYMLCKLCPRQAQFMTILSFDLQV